MKRYLAFAGSSYYPDGGWDDFRGEFDELVEVKLSLRSSLECPMGNSKYPCTYDWAHVVDTATLEKVVHWQPPQYGLANPKAPNGGWTPGKWSDE